MAARKRFTLEFTSDVSKAQRGFGQLDKAAGGWQKKLSTFAKGAALGIAGVGVAAVKFGLDFVEAAEESAKVGKQTAAVIKSMGDVAGISAEGVAELAEKLSMKAGIDDELIQSGANVLLTFGNIRNEVGKGNDVFDRATTAALDMSVAMDQDMKSSVVQLGKALNDPIAGISALTRVGVQFTDQQKDQIKALVESGDVMGAQKVIIAELEKQFGGSAEAQATASDKLKVAFGNISEQIGAVLLPHVEAFSNWMLEKGVPLIENEVIPAIEDFAHWVGVELAPDLAELGRTLKEDVAPGLKTLSEALTKIPTEAQLALASLGLLARFGGFGVLSTAAVAMAKGIAVAFGFVGFAATFAWNLISRAVPFASILVLAYFFRDQLAGVFGAIGRLFQRMAMNIQNWGANAVNAVVGFFTSIPGRIGGAIGSISRIFGNAMSAAWSSVSGWVGSIVDTILSIPGRIAGIGGRIASSVRSGLSGALGGIDLTPGFDLPGFGGFLAEGGVVTSPTLAVIGEAGPEAVVPLDGRLGLAGPQRIAVTLGAAPGGDRAMSELVMYLVRRGVIQLNVNGQQVAAGR